MRCREAADNSPLSNSYWILTGHVETRFCSDLNPSLMFKQVIESGWNNSAAGNGIIRMTPTSLATIAISNPQQQSKNQHSSPLIQLLITNDS
jgi:hypothetical protein